MREGQKEFNQNKTLLMIANVDWFFISHRLVIAKEAIKQGWKVYVAAEDTGRGSEIAVGGIEFIDFKFFGNSANTKIVKHTLNCS